MTLQPGAHLKLFQTFWQYPAVTTEWSYCMRLARRNHWHVPFLSIAVKNCFFHTPISKHQSLWDMTAISIISDTNLLLPCCISTCWQVQSVQQKELSSRGTTCSPWPCWIIQEIMDLMCSCMSVFIRKTMLGIHWNAWGDCWVFVIEGFISKKNKQNKHLCDLISLSCLCSGEHCISQVPQCGDLDHQINPGTISSVNAVEFENSSVLTSAGEYFRSTSMNVLTLQYFIWSVT